MLVAQENQKTFSNHAVLAEEPQWGGEKYKVFFEVIERHFNSKTIRNLEIYDNTTLKTDEEILN